MASVMKMKFPFLSSPTLAWESNFSHFPTRHAVEGPTSTCVVELDVAKQPRRSKRESCHRIKEDQGLEQLGLRCLIDQTCLDWSDRLDRSKTGWIDLAEWRMRTNRRLLDRSNRNMWIDRKQFDWSNSSGCDSRDSYKRASVLWSDLFQP